MVQQQQFYKILSKEPQPRDNHTAFNFGLKHFHWGGDGGSVIQTTLIDTFDISSTKWEDPKVFQGSSCGPLWGTAVTTDGENTYTFEGYHSSTLINTVYEINPRTMQCRELPHASSYSPPAMSYSGLVFFDEKLVVYTGCTDQGLTSDLYVFDLRKSECKDRKCFSFLVSGAPNDGRFKSILRPLLVSV